MLCEPRLSVVIDARGDMQLEDFHSPATRRERKKQQSDQEWEWGDMNKVTCS
jgi:hypothetical protein